MERAGGPRPGEAAGAPAAGAQAGAATRDLASAIRPDGGVVLTEGLQGRGDIALPGGVHDLLVGGDRRRLVGVRESV